MASIVSKKYSDALFMIALEKNMVQKFDGEVRDLKEIFKMNKEIGKTLSHPQLPLQNKIEIVDALFDGKASKEVVALMKVVLKKGRQEHMIEIFEDFVERCKKNANVSTALVMSAEKLNDSYIKKIKQELENKTSKNIEIEERIDDRLIGGVKIIVDNLLFDGSVDGKIKNINKAIS